jgi:hypothetical protein
MPAHLMTALFDGAARAGAAADRLVAMGLDRDAVRLIPQDGTPAAGVWDALANLRLPDADRYGYAEAIRRGGVLLAIVQTRRSCVRSRKPVPSTWTSARTSGGQAAGVAISAAEDSKKQRAPPYRTRTARSHTSGFPATVECAPIAL